MELYLNKSIKLNLYKFRIKIKIKWKIKGHIIYDINRQDIDKFDQIRLIILKYEKN